MITFLTPFSFFFPAPPGRLVKSGFFPRAFQILLIKGSGLGHRAPAGGEGEGRRARNLEGKGLPGLRTQRPYFRGQFHVPRPVLKTIPRCEREVPSSCPGAPLLLTWLSSGCSASPSHPLWGWPPLGVGAINGDYRPPSSIFTDRMKKERKQTNKQNPHRVLHLRGLSDLGKAR